MGEALLIKAGRASENGGSSSYELKTEIITANKIWSVPKALNQSFSVRIFGGGGGAGGTNTATTSQAGGGGGYMNNTNLILNQGDMINIVIGSGGNGARLLRYNTKYGSDLFTNAYTGGTTSFGSYLSANGGGRASYNYGGSGGSGGGGQVSGGIGYQFGGGGGNGGGYGGKWGGGGTISSYSRGGCLYENTSNSIQITGYSDLAGNGGTSSANATNGTNTIGLGLEFEGAGLAGNNNGSFWKCGGGGYGGNGGTYYGGGGGYGGNGGDNYGGGGGYGGDGGNYYGGGGGYGKGGSDSDGEYGGGGGGIVSNTANSSYPGYYDYIFANGGNGICIIQYYV